MKKKFWKLAILLMTAILSVSAFSGCFLVGMMIEEIEINSDEVEINVADYNSGIYFFNVDGEVVKVIIEN